MEEQVEAAQAVQDKELEAMKQRYKNVFSSMEGQVVIRDMMVKAGFDRHILTEEDRIKSNFMKDILFMCGGFTTQILGIHQ